MGLTRFEGDFEFVAQLQLDGWLARETHYQPRVKVRVRIRVRVGFIIGSIFGFDVL